MADVITSLHTSPHDLTDTADTVSTTDRETILDFSGRFRFGIDQWAYVPFTVPPGVRRIIVSTRHDKFSLLGAARNVLDLGIFGPAGHDIGNVAGFRGWSGGARDGFVLSAAAATPGYLPGPITPGRWALAFGPVVLNPLGMSWQARVVLEHGDPEPSPSPRPAIAGGLKGAGWYRGDLHLHTVHSDGHYRPDELATIADAAGLDFLVSTDHNTNAANRSWPVSGVGGPEIIAGEEVTTRHGHWLAIGLPPDGWVDWRYAPRDGVFEDFAAHVRAGGGMVVAAHPAVPLPGAAWEFGYRDVDAIEVWNGLWNLDDEVALRIWHRLLVQGRHISAVGGSDSHGAHQEVGRPQTVVYATNTSPSSLIEGLRGGRCYIAESDSVTVRLSATAHFEDAGTPEKGPGETLEVPPDAPLTVCASVHGVPHSTITLVTANGCSARARVGASGTATLRWCTVGATPRFARVEVRRIQRRRRGSMVAITNPVWFT